MNNNSVSLHILLLLRLSLFFNFVHPVSKASTQHIIHTWAPNLPKKSSFPFGVGSIWSMSKEDEDEDDNENSR